MAIYKYSHKLYSPTACGGGNRILTMTDEIMTVLLMTFTPPPTQTSISHSSSEAASAAAIFYWLCVFALDSHSSADATKAQKPLQGSNRSTLSLVTILPKYLISLACLAGPDSWTPLAKPGLGHPGGGQ